MICRTTTTSMAQSQGLPMVRFNLRCLVCVLKLHEITLQLCAINDNEWDQKHKNQIEPASKASFQIWLCGGKGKVPMWSLFLDAGIMIDEQQHPRMDGLMLAYFWRCPISQYRALKPWDMMGFLKYRLKPINWHFFQYIPRNKSQYLIVSLHLPSLWLCF